MQFPFSFYFTIRLFHALLWNIRQSFWRNCFTFFHFLLLLLFTAPNYVVESELEFAVPAKGIRFLPYNSVTFTCMRVEVYGVYMTKQMCTHTGLKPDLVRNCVGSRDCGKNAKCVHSIDSKGIMITVIVWFNWLDWFNWFDFFIDSIDSILWLNDLIWSIRLIRSIWLIRLIWFLMISINHICHHLSRSID